MTSSDITKCTGKDCPVKKHCHRYLQKAGHWQSYFSKSPGKIKDGKFTCDMFWGENCENIMSVLKMALSGKSK